LKNERVGSSEIIGNSTGRRNGNSLLVWEAQGGGGCLNALIFMEVLGLTSFFGGVLRTFAHFFRAPREDFGVGRVEIGRGRRSSISIVRLRGEIIGNGVAGFVAFSQGAVMVSTPSLKEKVSSLAASVPGAMSIGYLPAGDAGSVLLQSIRQWNFSRRGPLFHPVGSKRIPRIRRKGVSPFAISADEAD